MLVVYKAGAFTYFSSLKKSSILKLMFLLNFSIRWSSNWKKYIKNNDFMIYKQVLLDDFHSKLLSSLIYFQILMFSVTLFHGSLLPSFWWNVEVITWLTAYMWRSNITLGTRADSFMVDNMTSCWFCAEVSQVARVNTHAT